MMKDLKVISEGQRPFQLIENNEVLAELNYPKWYSTYSAEIWSNKGTSKLDIRVQGFWKNYVELWNGDQCIAQSKMNWNLSVIIKMGGKEYLLKMKSLSEGVFVLLDAEKNELLYIDADMNWLSAKASYQIRFKENENFQLSPEQILFLVHNCNYFMALSGNGGGTEFLAAI